MGFSWQHPAIKVWDSHKQEAWCPRQVHADFRRGAVSAKLELGTCFQQTQGPGGAAWSSWAAPESQQEAERRDHSPKVLSQGISLFFFFKAGHDILQMGGEGRGESREDEGAGRKARLSE